ncbi:Zn-dependent hydrolase [Bacillus sp. H-16]|uniref:Zn-dependent hydrolase n=1 Tax=Alteribacter salitolerans TaxID=2912333 RepID=UPI0019634647|nr:Zn-dependent hydrolase [Alteribacter salitolerans]MBM7094460.1 Zn-dependent hydrolase [Alteribacter salitolerans]
MNSFSETFIDTLLKKYDHTLTKQGVNGERIAKRLGALSEIGLTPDSGSGRMGFSNEERAAKNLLIRWMKAADLEVREDGAGNVIGKLEGSDMKDRVVMAGSHLDSVPNGGHFDGPLGVLAALEVVEAWTESGYKPPKTYELVIFSDEEGSRFKSGLTGSTAMTGHTNQEKMRAVNDVFSTPFKEVLEQVGLKEEGFFHSSRDFSDVEAFFEVHIEQGKRLEKEGLPVGIVSGIAGPCWLQVSFKGKAGHAGNTPMDDRQDALAAAGDFVRQVYSAPAEVSTSAVATVGQLQVYPNGINVIPGEVVMTVDIRDIHKKTRDELANRIKELARQTGEKYNTEVSFDEKVRIPPVPVQESVLSIVEEAVASLDIRPVLLPSGAGHDAMMIGRCVPVGMIFVRSLDGVSHHPAEWSSLNDCVLSIHALKRTIELTMERGI